MTVENRGTSNTNDRGSAEARRKRKTWLFEVWAADWDVLTFPEVLELQDAFEEDGLEGKTLLFPAMAVLHGIWVVAKGLGVPAVRCFRCGDLLTWETVECDRIKPGCEGGRYQKNNIRPVCGDCNKTLSGEYVKRRNAKRKKRNEQARAQRAKKKSLEREREKIRSVMAGTSSAIIVGGRDPAPMTLANRAEAERSINQLLGDHSNDDFALPYTY